MTESELIGKMEKN